MTNVIVAFSRPEDAKNIRNILVKRGYDVAAVCTSGSQAISSADELGSGILICGARFADMVCQDVYECVPDGIAMLLLASPGQITGGRIPPDLMHLSLPLKVHELVEALEMLMQVQERRRRKRKNQLKERSSEEQEFIRMAKERLCTCHHMTEAEAHRYIQKCSMDSGTNMTETAQMIMRLTDAG